MTISVIQILLLAILQGAAELLPVSSSAHVIVAEKLMGLNPALPELTFLLVMLHTGTMLAVIVYFWRTWRKSYFSSAASFKAISLRVVVATGATVILGLALKRIIEQLFLQGGEVELLFSRLPLIAGALFAVGVLIIGAGSRKKRDVPKDEISLPDSAWIGVVQGLCLPFRGFSRSGATISTGLLLGVGKVKMEEFSFALAVVLTPAVIGKEFLRLLHSRGDITPPGIDVHLIGPGLLGMLFSFISGLFALRFLARVLEKEHWTFFGYYCVAAAAFVAVLSYSSP